MAAPTPTGLISTPVAALARLVAASEAFQELVGVDNDQDALDFVHFQEVPDEVDPESDADNPQPKTPPPFAVVYVPEGWRIKRNGPGSWSDPGVLNLWFIFPIPDEHRYKATGHYRSEFLYAGNLLGEIIAEMIDASGTVDSEEHPRLNAMEIEFTESPMPCDADHELGYFWGCNFRIHYP